MKVLFMGDSVTDAGRDRSDPHDMGNGYPKYASAMIADAFPDIDFEFINLGIGGDQTGHIIARMQSDIADVAPDLTVLLIGVNDVWRYFDANTYTTNETFENNLRTILETVRSTGARLVMLEPFVLYGSDKEYMLAELDDKIRIERKLAQEYADAYLPLHALLAAETVKAPYTAFSLDGVHPNADGAALIAQYLLGTVSPIIESMAD